jgi:hypothetical protein
MKSLFRLCAVLFTLSPSLGAVEMTDSRHKMSADSTMLFSIIGGSLMYPNGEKVEAWGVTLESSNPNFIPYFRLTNSDGGFDISQFRGKLTFSNEIPGEYAFKLKLQANRTGYISESFALSSSKTLNETYLDTGGTKSELRLVFN